MIDLSTPWRRCDSCDRGRIVRFISVDTCAKCRGTGIDLLDGSIFRDVLKLFDRLRLSKDLHLKETRT